MWCGRTSPADGRPRSIWGRTGCQVLYRDFFEFTGGTGRYAGASGDGTLDALVQFTGPLDGISTWGLSGTLNTVPETANGGLATATILGVGDRGTGPLS